MHSSQNEEDMQTTEFIHVEIGGDIRNVQNPIPTLDYRSQNKCGDKVNTKERGPFHSGWWPPTQNMEVGR